MRKAADFTEKSGKSAEYYYCSSDPASLDCVIIGDIVLADGTAPHLLDVKIPGARDEIINLGEFWDTEKLEDKIAEINTLMEYKSGCYGRAYKYLSACLTLREVNRSLVFPAIKQKKLEGAVTRILRDVPKGGGFKIIPAITDSVGMKGRSKFDTYIKCAEKLYIIDDFCDTAGFYLSLLIKQAQLNENELRVSYCPVDPSVPDAVYFCETGTTFVVGEKKEPDKEYSRINMKRFVNMKQISAIKSEYKHNAKLGEALLDSACEALAQAGIYHDMLEKIYSGCMDFDALNCFTNEFCEKFLK